MKLLVSRRELSLAWSTIKGRKEGFVAAFVAALFGSAVVTACGILLETGLRSGVPAERYQAAAVVVGARQALPVDEDIDPGFSERVRVPADLVDKVQRVSGVRVAVGDVGVPMTMVTPDGRLLDGPDGSPLLGHGWAGSVLGPFTVSAGRRPAAPDEVVLEAWLARRAGVSVNGSVTLVVGSTAVTYRVTGLVSPPGGKLSRQSALFLTDERARRLTGNPDQVDAVGVLADPGTDAAELAAAIEAAVPGVVTYTGDDRSDVESLDVGRTRAILIELAASFGATMVLIVMIVMASTLALTVARRRRELALLRAIGATPKQVLGMIGAEAVLVGAVAAALGAIPGIAVAFLLHGIFTAVGVLPQGFALAVSPLPVLAAMALCVLGARSGGWIAARRAARVSPAEALGEVAVERRGLGWLRLTIGLLLIPVALAAAIVAPIVLPGEAAVDGASSSALLLVIALALLGPRILGGALALLGPRMNRSGVSGFLAVANSRARSRRLSSATTPLIMGVTLAAAQIFSATTLDAAAHRQTVDGILAGHVLIPRSAGLSPGLADAIRGLDGVAAVTRLVRTQTIVTYPSGDSEQYKVFPTQGVDVEGIEETLDLGVIGGDIAALRGDTVALSRLAAGTVGAAVGETIDLHLGDGTSIRPRVVALYEKGLGFGDVTLPHDLAIRHVTGQLDASMLVGAERGASPAAVGATLRSAMAAYPTVTVADRTAVLVAQGAGDDPAISLLLNAIMLGYLAIAVVNTLVVATAARAREFGVLRLIGARRRQVRAMMRHEAQIIVIAAVVAGTLGAVPSLIGVSFALSRSAVPAIPALPCAGIVAVAALIAWPAIMISARIAMRPAPVDVVTSTD